MKNTTQMLRAVLVVMAAAAVAGGWAAERKVIEITTFDQIRKIDKDTVNYPSNAHYKLMNDIDASSSKTTVYNPGSLSNGGIFDGRGFTIRRLYIVSFSSSDSNYVGLFGGVFTDSSRITNLRVEIDSIYVSKDNVGGIAGINEGTISNCSVAGIVRGGYNVGGLVGLNKGTITNCYAKGLVIGDRPVGGLVGLMGKGTITNCYATGWVRGSAELGGLVGTGIPSNVISSYWDTEASGRSTSPGGGIGKTTAQMKMKSTFVGWDFDTIWTIKEGVEYPTLSWLGEIVSGTFTLRYSASPGGYIAIGDTVQIVEYGSRGAMVVAMPDEGYEFTMWSDGASNFVRTDSNVTSNKTVTANFCAAASIKPLVYKAGAGGAISGPAEQKVCGNTSGLQVTAVPNEGYKFVEWSDGKKDAARTDAGGASGVDVTASFVIKTYTLVYTAGPNGSLIGGDTVFTVAHGSDGGIVLALADDGYEFVKWSDNVTSNPRTDRNVSANIAASAVFDTLRHNLSYYVSPAHGVLAGSASQRVTHGANGSAVYVTGVNGSTFVEWSDGSKDTVRIDRNVQADIAVTAVFKDASGNVISVVSRDRAIPQSNPSKGSAVIAPAAPLTAEFAAGPNPVGALRATPVYFFRSGAVIKSANLFVYDASGNAVRKISINDNIISNNNSIANNNAVIGNSSRRAVGSWDLTDKKGRRVPEGTYLVKGVIKTRDGKHERVSAAVGVR